ncbi:MAG TPA: UDP-N-acetylmuramate dehydrogenase [Fimbriimonadaceae bacterium]|nr:UDP-N-acetylmuramate dehydrogenase [Fimbriimonadaceae bacterium]HRJ95328.1 UDP-N-acetylmuramate dehydrogenase [Fimbriimonadaceae bacterium]
MEAPLRETRSNVSLAPLTTLRAGGAAERFWVARTVDQLAAISGHLHAEGTVPTILGHGSNVLPSDDGVPGDTVHVLSRRIEIEPSGVVTADCGCAFQDLFLATAQAGFLGFEYAVGIPGTLGGALVSNAGAYRSNVSEFLTELEVVHSGERRWVEPTFMSFSYRDSRLRRPRPEACTLLRARFRLPRGIPKAIYDEAREYQRQRISKQPPPASAGSFFKNVTGADFAASLENLPDRLRNAGVVPAGFLIQEAGLSGFRHKGAMIARRHANFIVNVGGATAFAIRELAELAKRRVLDQFGVLLEEEVLYLGDWSRFGTAEA